MPVYQIHAADVPQPRGIGEIYKEDGQTRRIELIYGNPLLRQGLRLAFIHSSSPGHGPEPRDVVTSLHRQYGLGAVGGVERRGGEVAVDGEQVEAEFLSSDRMRVAGCRAPAAELTLGGVGWRPEAEWQLRQVGDLQSLLTGRDEYLRRIREEAGW